MILSSCSVVPVGRRSTATYRAALLYSACCLTARKWKWYDFDGMEERKGITEIRRKIRLLTCTSAVLLWITYYFLMFRAFELFPSGLDSQRSWHTSSLLFINYYYYIHLINQANVRTPSFVLYPRIELTRLCVAANSGVIANAS